MINFRVQHPPIHPSHAHHQAISKKTKNNNFKELFKTELTNETNLKISKHAETRFQQRGISLSNEMWKKVENAVEHARTKGVTEALVLTKEAALVVSTKNKLVITALDRQSAEEQIFTNINGTILIER